MGEVCARELIRRPLITDDCSYCASRNARQHVLLRVGCSLPAENFSFKLLEFSDTEQVKYRNARLSH